MRQRNFTWRGVAALALCFSWLAATGWARAAEQTYEAQLLWGTDQEKSPNPNHKPVSEATKERLKRLPLKWKNYFEVNSQTFSIAPGGSQKVTLSHACEIQVQALPDNMVSVTQYGKGREVARQKQVLPPKEVLVLGGNAPGANAWLVILKRVE